MEKQNSSSYSHKLLSLYNLKGLIEEMNKTGGNKYQALIYTSSGIFRGDICEIASTISEFIIPIDEDIATLDISYVYEMANVQCKSFLESNPNNNIIYENPCFLSLKNVTIVSSFSVNDLINQDQICIFVDQIVGFSYKKVQNS